jgi:sulfite exporter TauE/SafE
MLDLDVGLLVAAWLTGLAGGSGHCLGMCGGIVGALGVRQRPGVSGFAVLAAAHTGRVLGYAAAGAAVGFAGAAVFGSLLGPAGIAALRAGAAVLVALIGLQLLIGRSTLAPFERAGARFWRRLGPLVRPLLPPRDPLRGLAAGALWGFLPCGLVYSELAVAAASGGALQGAFMMTAFGLGTSVSLSALSALLQSLGIGRLPRQLSGALLIVFGVWMLLPLGAAHREHAAAPAVEVSAPAAHSHGAH